MGSVEERLRSALMVRNGALVLGLVLPPLFVWLVWGNAARLDALAAHGASTVGRVSAVRDTIADYEYEVDGRRYAFNVATDELPLSPGASCPVMYLPEEPSFSRPISDGALAAAKAAHHRTVGGTAALIAFVLLMGFAVLAHRDVVRLRAGIVPPPVTPEAYRRRLLLMGVFGMLPAMVAIGAFHARDAMAKGESLVPVVIGGLLPVALIGGVFWSAARRGPTEAMAWVGRWQRWLVPAALGVAVLRVIAALFGH